MMKSFKNKPKKEKIKFIIITALVAVLVLLAVLSDVLFKGSEFANFIALTIGGFFNIVKFFTDNYMKLLESAAILLFVWVLCKVITFLISLTIKKGHRSETVGMLLKSIAKYASVTAALFLVLSAWGVQTSTLLAGAGIIGLALSFGAQSLIEDIISGLFIIFEKMIVVGDVVQIGDFRGTVIDLGLRTTKFEDLNGDIKIINNSDIRGIINTSAHLSPAICDISIGYGEDLKRVEEVIAKALPDIKRNIHDIEEGPYYRGVQSLGDSSVVIRILAKTHESKKFQVVRDLNREMKLLFDHNKISIPFPQLVVHYEKDEQEKTTI